MKPSASRPLTAEYLVHELGLEDGKDEFQPRTPARLAELQQTIFMAKGGVDFEAYKLASYKAQALYLPRLFTAINLLFSPSTLASLDPSLHLSKDTAEKTYHLMQRLEIFSTIAVNLSGLVSYLKTLDEDKYIKLEAIVLMLYHYSMRNWEPQSPAHATILPFAINTTTTFLQFAAFHEFHRAVFKTHRYPFPSSSLTPLAVESYHRLRTALLANCHHGFKPDSSSAEHVKQEVQGTLALWDTIFAAMENGGELVENEDLSQTGTFLTACEDEGMANCVGSEGRGPGTLICSKCRVARYCSKEHQKSSWRDHKPVCIRPIWMGP